MKFSSHRFNIVRIENGSEKVVYEGQIYSWNAVNSRIVKNHLAMRSDRRVNRDVGTAKYVVRYPVSPRGPHANKFFNLSRETWGHE